MRLLVALALFVIAGCAALAAQAAARRPRLEGKWQARGPDDAIHDIMVRSDSSAQFGDQVARWRVVGDSLWLTLGDGAWMVYGMKVELQKLTLSGGDLEKPVTLRRVGAATPRPDTLAVPEPPPASARAW
ncbi:MAG: hypothetical protein HYS40_02290 [Gemmatimonadetes bacterium]|nr:hypothetical protein [Gemmatimonadota bacterium]